MRIVEHSPSRLVLSDRPWLVWVVGAALAGAGACVALFGGEPLFGALFVAIGLGANLAGGHTTVNTFDRATGLFVQERKGWLPRRAIQHPLTEIRAVRVVRGSSRSQTYRVELALASGRIPLTQSFDSGMADKDATAALIRSFVGLPPQPECEAPGIRDLLGMLGDPTDRR